MSNTINSQQALARAQKILEQAVITEGSGKKSNQVSAAIGFANQIINDAKFNLIKTFNTALFERHEKQLGIRDYAQAMSPRSTGENPRAQDEMRMFGKDTNFRLDLPSVGESNRGHVVGNHELIELQQGIQREQLNETIARARENESNAALNVARLANFRGDTEKAKKFIAVALDANPNNQAAKDFLAQMDQSSA